MNSAKHIVLSLLLLLSVQGRAQSSANSLQPRSALGGVASQEFNKPLYFDQVNQGVVIPPMEIEYEIVTGEKSGIKIGPVFISDETFKVELWHRDDLKASQQAVLSDLNKDSSVLILSWPHSFLTPQMMEAISGNGRVLWSQEITSSQLNSWEQIANKDGLRTQAPFRESQLALQNWTPPESLLRLNESFRLCFSQQLGEEKTRLCTGNFGFQKTEKGLLLRRRISDQKVSRVLVENEIAPDKGAVPLAKNGLRVFYAELTSGALVEILARSPDFELMDIIESPRESRLRIVGSGARPFQKSILLNQEEYNSLTRLIGFEETIGDTRVIWASGFNEKEPRLYFPGRSGALFKQRFELSQIPSYKSRIFLSRKMPTSTYSSEVSLLGVRPERSVVESKENSVEINKSDKREFTWNFKSEEKGQINRSYLTVQSNGQTFRSYYEVYRGYASELSARLSAVQSVSFVFMGEVALNHWFENILGWDNYWVSRHRWGVSAKYFQSLSGISLSNGQRNIQLSATTADLKFRLSPGLWGRDETLGILGSYQEVKFGESQAPMAGFGAFWARSMPRSLDSVFNLLPVLNYPKWVNMEFIYYTTPLKSEIQLNSSMALNFHGKVLWSENLFGEAGFGIKRYAYKDLSLNQLAELNTFYGTIGVGVTF